MSLAFIGNPERPKSGASTKITIPSTKSTERSTKVEVKNANMDTGGWTRSQIANENYRNLGPNGAPTPACPTDSSRCPDMNNRLQGATLTQTQIQAQCPEVCIVSRQGNLDGSTPAICPAGYAQMAAFDVQDEWIPNPDYASAAAGGNRVDTNDYNTFKARWRDPENYRCVSQFVGYGDRICYPYQGSNAPFPYKWEGCKPGGHASGGPCVPASTTIYDVVFRANPYTVNWGMNNNGDQPFRNANPVYYAHNNLSLSAYNSGVATEVAAGVRGKFTTIRNQGKMPSTWAAFDNIGYLTRYPVDSPGWWGNWFHHPDGAMSPAYEPPFNAPSTKTCINLGRAGKWCYDTPGGPVPITYNNSSCTSVAWTNSPCPVSGVPRHPVGGVWKSPNCPRLWIKIQIPVYEMYCLEKPKKLKPSGHKVPTSLLCGRVKSEWQ